MPASARQRAFNGSLPRSRKSSMPTTTAKVTAPCPLCDVRVKAGQRVAKHYGSGQWAHIGCVVRLTAMLNS